MRKLASFLSVFVVMSDSSSRRLLCRMNMPGISADSNAVKPVKKWSVRAKKEQSRRNLGSFMSPSSTKIFPFLCRRKRPGLLTDSKEIDSPP